MTSDLNLTPKDSYGYHRVIKDGKLIPNVFVTNKIKPNTVLIVNSDTIFKRTPRRSGTLTPVNEVMVDNLPMSLRSPETQRRYEEDKAAGKTIPLNQVERKKEFTYFYIIHNDYPYDGVNIAESCDMLVIRRDGVAKMSEFTHAEIDEYMWLEEGYINTHYDHLQKNTDRSMSQPGRWHIHLLTKLASRRDVRL